MADLVRSRADGFLPIACGPGVPTSNNLICLKSTCERVEHLCGTILRNKDSLLFLTGTGGKLRFVVLISKSESELLR
jgi:hypothetical protein